MNSPETDLNPKYFFQNYYNYFERDPLKIYHSSFLVNDSYSYSSNFLSDSTNIDSAQRLREYYGKKIEEEEENIFDYYLLDDEEEEYMIKNSRIINIEKEKEENRNKIIKERVYLKDILFNLTKNNNFLQENIDELTFSTNEDEDDDFDEVEDIESEIIERENSIHGKPSAITISSYYEKRNRMSQDNQNELIENKFNQRDRINFTQILINYNSYQISPSSSPLSQYFLPKPLPSSPQEIKILYLIFAHDKESLLHRLINALNDTEASNDFLIYVDKKSEVSFLLIY